MVVSFEEDSGSERDGKGQEDKGGGVEFVYDFDDVYQYTAG